MDYLTKHRGWGLPNREKATPGKSLSSRDEGLSQSRVHGAPLLQASPAYILYPLPSCAIKAKFRRTGWGGCTFRWGSHDTSRPHCQQAHPQWAFTSKHRQTPQDGCCLAQWMDNNFASSHHHHHHSLLQGFLSLGVVDQIWLLGSFHWVFWKAAIRFGRQSTTVPSPKSSVEMPAWI